MIRAEYPKKLRTCWAIARASSSFIPVRSIEFLIARVRSSTVSVPAGARSDFVLTAMGRLGAAPLGGRGYLRVLRRPPSFDSQLDPRAGPRFSDLIADLAHVRRRQKVNARGPHVPTGWRRVWTWSGFGPLSPGSRRGPRRNSKRSCENCGMRSGG